MPVRGGRLQGEEAMNLHKPTVVVFLISLVLAVLGLIGAITPSVAFLSRYDVWIVLVGYVVLAVGTLVEM
jgi:hypothetical protein